MRLWTCKNLPVGVIILTSLFTPILLYFLRTWARVSSTDKGLLYPLDRSVFHSPLVAQPGREQNQVSFHRIYWYTKSFTLLCLTIQFHYSVIIPLFSMYIPATFIPRLVISFASESNILRTSSSPSDAYAKHCTGRAYGFLFRS